MVVFDFMFVESVIVFDFVLVGMVDMVFYLGWFGYCSE